MTSRLDKRVLKNGMVVLGEPMEAVSSVAFDIMLPAGESMLEEGYCGASNVIADWIFRGAADRDSRQLSDELDGLGLHRLTSTNSSHITVGSALEAGNLAAAIDLYADIVLKPRLDSEQFEPARQLAMDAVHGLDDDPRQKVMLKLRENFYPKPLGRNTVGDMDQLAALTPDKTRQMIKTHFNLSDSIFCMAGKYDFEAVCEQLERLFEMQQPPAPAPPQPGRTGDKYTHIQNEGAQVHIGLMTGTVTVSDDDYYNARTAIAVLSGGMSARLFTEVREKRGLCYAIGARYHGLKTAAGIMCYAGTAPNRAQETLDVIIGEFERLSEGISPEELERAKVGLKSSVILQSESSSSRAGGIGADHYMLGRVRSLDEIKSRIDAATVDSVLNFLRTREFGDFTVVTIGPRELAVKKSD